LLAVSANVAHLQAQKISELQRPSPLQSNRPHATKAELVGRFQSLKNQYGTIKTRTGKFVPVRPAHPPAVRQARSELTSNMLAYDKAERGIQASLDSMSELGETESLRLQMAMDRLSKLMETLSNIMKKLSDTGDSIVQNMK
jgi:hypothetical protein